MSYVDLLFSFRGRIGRMTFAVGGLPVTLGIGLAIGIALNLGTTGGPAVGPMQGAAFVLAAAAVWISAALGAKRLHDLGKSGWMVIAIPAGPPLFLFGMAVAFKYSVLGLAGMAAGFALSVWSIWLAVQMSYFPGNPFDNDYGPPPNLDNLANRLRQVVTTADAAAGLAAPDSAPPRRTAVQGPSRRAGQSQGGFGRRALG